MSGQTYFKSLDPKRQKVSVYFEQGVKDGANDAQRGSMCPPIPALGPDPLMSWSYMYMQGYDRNCTPRPCVCDGSCKERDAQ